MNLRILKIIGIFLLLGASSAWASPPPWGPTGDHTFTDLDAPFGERSVFGTATLTITGGEFGSLYCVDHSTVYMSAGSADILLPIEKARFLIKKRFTSDNYYI